MILRVVPRIVRGHASCELRFSAWTPGRPDSGAELAAAKGILIGALISCAVWAGLVIL